jgi:hypothetical protein
MIAGYLYVVITQADVVFYNKQFQLNTNLQGYGTM